MKKNLFFLCFTIANLIFAQDLLIQKELVKNDKNKQIDNNNLSRNDQLKETLINGDYNYIANDNNPTNSVNVNNLAAPNSYIYDIDKARTNNLGGLYIPVKKAYDVWENTNGELNSKIPNLKQSVSIVWQDKIELIRTVSVVGSGINAKLKVEINSSQGKGNAVVALHVGNLGNSSDPIFWSWHIWVTDDPTIKSITYTNKKYDLSKENPGLTNTFMDRNLGALNENFLGYDWNKSGGLLYQWGRKDPFPPMRNRDDILLTYYVNDNKGILNNSNFSGNFVVKRPFSKINDNIKFSVQNPLKFIKRIELNSKSRRVESHGTWFADSINKFKVINPNDRRIASVNYDLWGDNNGGIVGKDSFVQANKSAYDPCPAGWRVPSFAHPIKTLPSTSPWGSDYKYVHPEKPGFGGYANEDYDKLKIRYPSAKFYPRMGVDFTKGVDNYNIGKYTLTGGFKDLGENVVYQDNMSESHVWSATLREIVQARFFHIISDGDKPNLGSYYINPYQDAPTAEGMAVRCVKDVRTTITFETEFFNNDIRNYREGLENPNSYILFKDRQVSIPVNKAYSVYNQVLTDGEWIPFNNATKERAHINWTTNTSLIESVELVGSAENGKINVKLNDNQYGNAVISYHIGKYGDMGDPVYWSWHIWVPKVDPEINTITYITDKSNPTTFNKVFNTKLNYPPIKTEFMRMELGAINTYEPSLGNDVTRIPDDSYGLFYQWGRKDPLPGFYDVSTSPYAIYKGDKLKGKQIYSTIENDGAYIKLGYQLANLQNSKSVKEMIVHSIQNPLNYLSNTNGSLKDDARDWISNKKALERERWGQATSKSIYDPCPAGWRVPDYGFAISINSPWAKADLFIRQGAGNEVFIIKEKQVLSSYKISPIGEKPKRKAFRYLDKNYYLGYLPAIGNRQTLEGEGTKLHKFGSLASIWSATMKDDYTGYVYGLDTATSGHFTYSVESPNEARNIVCSKDEPRFTEEYFKNLNKGIIVNRPSNVVIEEQKIENKTVLFYPNPVQDVLKTNFNDLGIIIIYNTLGSEVFKGSFKNNELNMSFLPSGMYFIKTQDGKVTKILKK